MISIIINKIMLINRINKLKITIKDKNKLIYKNKKKNIQN